jgi:DNA-binding XRE family transcriptional regulator
MLRPRIKERPGEAFSMRIVVNWGLVRELGGTLLILGRVPGSPIKRGSQMNKKEFSQIRYHLGKTQLQLSQLLGVSLKAVQSFEQGWRKVPVHTERQLLLMLALKTSRVNKNRPCWLIKECPAETRENCPAWEFSAGQICWLINGTICEGAPQKSWRHKIQICRKCGVFQSIFASMGDGTSTA